MIVVKFRIFTDENILQIFSILYFQGREEASLDSNQSPGIALSSKR